MTNICAEGGLEAEFLYNGEPYSLDETTEMYSRRLENPRRK